jgi:hypothetical protein
MSSLNNLDIEDICLKLSAAFQGVLSWKWDKRFETVLAEFAVNVKDKIRADLEQHLSSVFDSANVGNGSELVRAVDDRFGGLWPGQVLFTSDPNRDALVYCTWWPWGDGKAISLRIGSEYKNLSDSERADKIQLFKGWFGV